MFPSWRSGVWSWSSSCWLARPSLPSTAPRLRISPLPCRSCSTTPGSGFSPRECLTATEDVYNELTHEVSVTFVLPEDARAIRLDPGELACCITDLAISDERISFQSVNGLLLQEDSLLFLDVDPNLSLHCTTGFGAGMKFAVNYHYYPLGRFLHEQPGKSLRGR